MCGARAQQLFWAASDSYSYFWGEFYPLHGEWVGGMQRFGMISPYGLASFRLGIWTGLSLTCCPPIRPV